MVLFIIAISILINNSCTKTDIVSAANVAKHGLDFTEKFFATAPNLTPKTQQIISALKRENDKTGFVNKLPVNCGLPVWDKVHSRNKGIGNSLTDDSIIVIAMTNTNRSISCIILFDSTNLTTPVYWYTTNGHLYDACFDSSVSITSAESLLAFFMHTEYKLFGTDIFYHLPARVFKNPALPDTARANKFLRIGPTDNGSNFEQDDCFVIKYCNPGNVCDPLNGYCDNCSVCPWEWYCDIPPPTGGGGEPGGEGPTGGGDTGGGGGGNGPGDEPENCNEAFYFVNPCGPQTPPPPPPQDTCSNYIQNLEVNTNFVNVMKYLNSSTALGAPNEVGYEIRDITQYNSNSYIPAAGSLSQPTIDWNFPANTVTDGLIHSHYAGLNSIFTPEDVILMAQLFIANRAKDTNNLFFAMTSSYGVPNLIKVGNPAIFRAFCEKIVGLNGNDNKRMRKFIDKFYRKIDSNNSDTNEREFLKLIKDYGAENGLQFFQGNNNCNKWTKRKVDNFGPVLSVPCLPAQ